MINPENNNRVVEETLTATPDQGKEAFKTNVVQSASAPVAMSSPTQNINEERYSFIESNPPLKMLSQLSIQTGMNFQWSSKFLEEAQWNFQTALSTFQNLNAQGLVPAEAFTHCVLH